MILALYGHSSSGKTSIAKALCRHFESCPIRHCGEEVKARARDLGVALEDFSNEEHFAIDLATLAWVDMQTELAVVEGRYLQFVLSKTRAEVLLIELVCAHAERELRWSKRMGRTLDKGELTNMDGVDLDFSANMYGQVSPQAPRLTIDTSSTPVDQCVSQILEWLQKAQGT